eukprot:7128706-Prymnesium_polylepis.1
MGENREYWQVLGDRRSKDLRRLDEKGSTPSPLRAVCGSRFHRSGYCNTVSRLCAYVCVCRRGRAPVRA